MHYSGNPAVCVAPLCCKQKQVVRLEGSRWKAVCDSF